MVKYKPPSNTGVLSRGPTFPFDFHEKVNFHFRVVSWAEGRKRNPPSLSFL